MSGRGPAPAAPGRAVAETERLKSRAAAHVDRAAPAVILVRPQLGENIGAAARAMLNCGLSDLRLVQPRDGWPNVKALGAASGADAVLSRVRLCASVAEAVADLNLVHATTARPREMMKPVLAPRAGVAALRDAGRRGACLGLLFGPEKAGLRNEELVLADAIVQIPLNPAFASLNLAQAVLIMAYEWHLSGDAPPPPPPPEPTGSARAATKDEIVRLFEHLEGALDERGFFPTPQMRPRMVRNMRTMFERISLTHQDVQTLRGVVRALTGPRRGQPPRATN